MKIRVKVGAVEIDLDGWDPPEKSKRVSQLRSIVATAKDAATRPDLQELGAALNDYHESVARALKALGVEPPEYVDHAHRRLVSAWDTVLR